MFDILDFRFQKLPTEAEIIEDWPIYDKPKISVVCTTYNHALYIEDAIRGFLSQKTDFPFEIIIHDDASTDDTLKIINGFAEAYPNIIRVISQSINQYSYGKKIIPSVIKYTQGDYIAICEGDDFWIEPRKLQKQIYEMEMHDDCAMSFHSVTALCPDGRTYKIATHSEQLSIISPDAIISTDGSFCPTPSLIFKREVFDQLPKWFYSTAPVGDYYLQIFGALKGGGLFIPDDMSVYRVSSDGSWSESIRNIKEEDRIKFFERNIECLSSLEDEIGLVYSKSILQAKSHQALSIALFFLKKRNIGKFITFSLISQSYSKNVFFTTLITSSKRFILSRLS